MKNYRCYFQNMESEGLNIDEIFYMVKDYYFIELDLENWLYIRQRKDLDCEILVRIWDWKEQRQEIHTGNLYLTDWNVCFEIWHWWGIDELHQRIDECEKKVLYSN